MKKKISYAAIGDVGIDIYPKIGKQFPGGMALNSVFHAVQAGAHASAISAIGTDKQAHTIIQFCDENRISRDMVSVIDGVTDSVEIILDENGVPHYHNWNLGVLEKFRLNKTHENFLGNQDVTTAVYLPELKHLFDAFSKMNLPNTLKVGDFTDLSEHGGDQYVLNEYKDSFNIFALSIDEKVDARVESFSSFVTSQNKMGIALLGKRGSVVISDGKQFVQRANTVKVVDTTGAGDSYLSTFLVENLREKNMAYSIKKATHAATTVIQRYGASQI